VIRADEVDPDLAAPQNRSWSTLAMAMLVVVAFVIADPGRLLTVAGRRRRTARHRAVPRRRRDRPVAQRAVVPRSECPAATDWTGDDRGGHDPVDARLPDVGARRCRRRTVIDARASARD
jgi:hypothetical protein